MNLPSFPINSYDDFKKWINDPEYAYQYWLKYIQSFSVKELAEKYRQCLEDGGNLTFTAWSKLSEKDKYTALAIELYSRVEFDWGTEPIGDWETIAIPLTQAYDNDRFYHFYLSRNKERIFIIYSCNWDTTISPQTLEDFDLNRTLKECFSLYSSFGTTSFNIPEGNVFSGSCAEWIEKYIPDFYDGSFYYENPDEEE